MSNKKAHSKSKMGSGENVSLTEKFEDFWRSTEWQAYERNRIQEAFYAGAEAVAEDYSIQNVKVEIAAFKKGSGQ